MKFQVDISNMNTYTHTRTSRNQYVPHFFKVGGITKAGNLHNNNIQATPVSSNLRGPSFFRTSYQYFKVSISDFKSIGRKLNRAL